MATAMAEKVVLDGISCVVTQENFADGKHDVYRFTVPGWPECAVTGRRTARRVIRGRLDPAVRNTMGIDAAQREEGQDTKAASSAAQDTTTL